MLVPNDQLGPLSRSTRYKKVTKPLLERKRRARINRCLDELKELIVGLFEVEGDNVSKLEKADILELTVRHLSRLREGQDPDEEMKRFQAGFGQCAMEACQFIVGMPGIDHQISRTLVEHLSSTLALRNPNNPHPSQVSHQAVPPPQPPVQYVEQPETERKTEIIKKIREQILERQSKEMQENITNNDRIPKEPERVITKDYRKIHPKKIMIRGPRMEDHIIKKKENPLQRYRHKSTGNSSSSSGSNQRGLEDSDDDNMWRPW